MNYELKLLAPDEHRKFAEVYLPVNHLDVLKEIDDLLPRVVDCHTIEITDVGSRFRLSFPLYVSDKAFEDDFKKRLEKYFLKLKAKDAFGIEGLETSLIKLSKAHPKGKMFAIFRDDETKESARIYLSNGLPDIIKFESDKDYKCAEKILDEIFDKL